MKWITPLLQADWLATILKPLHRRYVEVILLSFFTNLLALVVPIFSLQVYDRVVAHQGTSTLIVLVIGAVIALGFDLLLRITRSQLLQKTASYIDAALGRAFYQKFQRLPLATLEQHPSSYWQSLFGDTQHLRAILSGSSALLVADLPFALIFLLVIFLIATPIAWLLLIILPAFVALAYVGTRLQEKAAATEQRKGRGREKLLAELLHGRATVKALNIDEAVKKDWEQQHSNVISDAGVRGTYTDNLTAFGQSLTLLCTLLMTSFGALAIIDQQMTFGALIAANMLVGRVVAPFNQLVGQWKQFANCRQSIQRLDRLFALPEERAEVAIERPRPVGKITLEHASFQYGADNPPIVQDISFTFEPGHIYGLVGRNGCGKSTLMKLMQGLYTPQEGRVLLDDADIQQFTRRQISQWIGYVPQFCYLFDGTIRENIAKGLPDATDDAILRASTLAGANHFIDDLPDGYATYVGEGGNRLSGGQRQRLAIARALLHNPPVLILDEVTSNLDSESESYLAQVLKALSKDRMILLATHSISLLQCCDQLVVMDKGRMVMAGDSRKVLPRITGQVPIPGEASATASTATPARKTDAALQPKPPSAPSQGDAA